MLPSTILLPDNVTDSDEDVIGSRACALAKLDQSGVHTSVLAIIPLQTVYAFLVDNGLLSVLGAVEAPFGRLPHTQLSEADYTALASIFDSHISSQASIVLSVSSDHASVTLEDTIMQTCTVSTISSFVDDLVSFWLAFAQHMLVEHKSPQPFGHAGSVLVATPREMPALSGHAMTGLLERVYIELDDDAHGNPRAFEINADTREVVWSEQAYEPDVAVVFALSKLMHQVEYVLGQRSVELRWAWDMSRLRIDDVYIFSATESTPQPTRAVSYEGYRASPGRATGRLVSYSHLATAVDPSSIVYVENPDSIDFDAFDVAGVISSGSGMYSPLAIVCRELGVPCIVDVDTAVASHVGQIVHISDVEPRVYIGVSPTITFAEAPNDQHFDTSLYVFARSWDQAQALASRSYDGLILESAALFHTHRVTNQQTAEHLPYFWQQSIERTLHHHGKRPVYYQVYARDGETKQPMSLSDELSAVLRAYQGSVYGHLRLVVGPIRDISDIHSQLAVLSRFELTSIPVYARLTYPGYVLQPDQLLSEEVDGVLLDCGAVYTALYGSSFDVSQDYFIDLLKQFVQSADRYGKHVILSLALDALTRNDFRWTADHANVALVMTAHEAEYLLRTRSNTN